jgi:hypothetical protein
MYVMPKTLTGVVIFCCLLIHNKQTNNKINTIISKNAGWNSEKMQKKKHPCWVLCWLFIVFWGIKNNQNACCRFPETNQTKMPKCVDLTKGTKWQWFISFDAGFGFAIF